MEIKRQDHEPPLAIEEWGWRFHHIGIPTIEPIKDEVYLPQFKFWVGGFNSSPYGIEWMRFKVDCPVDELIKKVPHVAFEVEDLDFELSTRNFTIITKPNNPGDGIKVAMIKHNGAPVELIEFDKSKIR